MATPNSARGEVAVEIEGVRHVMCLTLGALAKIESVTGATSLQDIGRKLADPKASHLIGTIAALLEGGGSKASEGDIARLPMNQLDALSEGMMAAFKASGFSGEGEERPQPIPSPSHGGNGSPEGLPLPTGAGSDTPAISSGA